MCESLRPGITVRPFASMILVLGPRSLKISRSLSIAMILPSATARASTNDGTPFVAILALCNIVSAGIEISLFLISLFRLRHTERLLVVRGQRVTDGLGLDESVAEDEGVDAVLGPVGPGRGRPFEEEHVGPEQRRPHLPVGLRKIREQLDEPLADAVPSPPDARRADLHRVFGEVRGEPVQ